MPLQKITLKPGVNRENTRYTNEGGWYESNLVRFRQGTPEKIGGWARISASTFVGVCRSLWNWITLQSRNLMGVGTSLKFYIENGGSYYDITPFRTTVTLTNPFGTTSGSPIVTVTDINANYANGDFVSFYNASAVGGLTISGEYQITYTSGSSYTITASSNASSTTTGGGTVYAAYKLNNGAGTVAALVGWGSGPWGGYSSTVTSAWGADGTATAPTTSALTIWNQNNWGQDLLYGQRGGPIYYWSANIGITPTTFTVSIAAPGVVTCGLASSLTDGQGVILSTTGALPTGLLPGVTYYVKTIVSNTFNLSATPGGAAITTSGTQSGVHSILPNGVLLSTSAGASDVPTAVNYFLISDVSRFVIAFGTYDYLSSTFDPMLVRWSDQGSLTQWTPAVTNQAGSIRLSHGSKILSALQSRQEVLVWTDSSLYNLQYVGPPYVWSSQLLSDNVSIVGPNAAAVASNMVFWMGADKFYIYDGRVQTLNCDLRSYIYSDINLSQSDQFFASTSEGFNEVWFFYCSSNATTVDRYVIYNYLEKVWYYGSMARTAWIDSGLRAYPTAATYSSNLVNQELGVDDNTTGTPVAMNAYITSAQFDIGDGDHMGFVWRMMPDLTFRNSTATNPTLTMSLQGLTNSGSGYNNPESVAGPNANATATVTSTFVPTTSAQVDQYTGQIYIRLRGRQMSMKVESSQLGVQWQMGSPRIDIRPDGRR